MAKIKVSTRVEQVSVKRIDITVPFIAEVIGAVTAFNALFPNPTEMVEECSDSYGNITISRDQFFFIERLHNFMTQLNEAICAEEPETSGT